MPRHGHGRAHAHGHRARDHDRCARDHDRCARDHDPRARAREVRHDRADPRCHEHGRGRRQLVDGAEYRGCRGNSWEATASTLERSRDAISLSHNGSLRTGCPGPSPQPARPRLQPLAGCRVRHAAAGAQAAVDQPETLSSRPNESSMPCSIPVASMAARASSLGRVMRMVSKVPPLPSASNRVTT